MSKNHGSFDSNCAEPTMLEVMQVRPTDTAKGDLHAHLPSLKRFRFQCLNPQILWCMYDEAARLHTGFIRVRYLIHVPNIPIYIGSGRLIQCGD
jgi:hypothetical protein